MLLTFSLQVDPTQGEPFTSTLLGGQPHCPTTTLTPMGGISRAGANSQAPRLYARRHHTKGCHEPRQKVLPCCGEGVSEPQSKQTEVQHPREPTFGEKRPSAHGAMAEWRGRATFRRRLVSTKPWPCASAFRQRPFSCSNRCARTAARHPRACGTRFRNEWRGNQLGVCKSKNWKSLESQIEELARSPRGILYDIFRA